MRYGSIRYVNNLPVDHGLLSGAVPAPAGFTVLEGTPAELNRALLAGQVDASAVSSALLLDDPGDLRILAEATIASHGPVDSVLLVSKTPFDRLDGKAVAVSEESASGALLLRILLENDVGVRPTYRPMKSGLAAMLREAEAALLIGDDALRFSARLDRSDIEATYEVLDLGEAWRAYTGLPMVYALWVARGQVADRDPEAVVALRAALTASRTWATGHREKILEEGRRRTGVAHRILDTYYDRLTHTLGTLEADGLRRFFEEAAALDRKQVPLVDVPTVEVAS